MSVRVEGVSLNRWPVSRNPVKSKCTVRRGRSVDEWRKLWDGPTNNGRSLSWLVTEERILEMEVVMLEECRLTLPPETEPLRGLWRSSQLNGRREALYDTHVTRARRGLLR